MNKVSATIKEEIEALVPPTIYFFIGLHIVAIIRALMLKGEGIAISTTVSIALTALVLGKSVVIADLLPWINRFPKKPLVHNIAWKTLIYALVAMVIHYLERLIDFWRAAGGFFAGNEKLLAEIIWPHFWAIQIVLVVMVVVYCTMHELVRVLGREKMTQLFFGPT